jgi:hypothetical protein
MYILQISIPLIKVYVSFKGTCNAMKDWRTSHHTLLTFSQQWTYMFLIVPLRSGEQPKSCCNVSPHVVLEILWRVTSTKWLTCTYCCSCSGVLESDFFCQMSWSGLSTKEGDARSPVSLQKTTLFKASQKKTCPHSDINQQKNWRNLYDIHLQKLLLHFYVKYHIEYG